MPLKLKDSSDATRAAGSAAADITGRLESFRPGGKVMTVSEAIEAFVRPGMSIHYAYAQARPNALLMEVARRFAETRPKFTLVVPSLVGVQSALVELGLVDRLITSFAAETYPTAAPNRAVQRAVDSGAMKIENWSLWSWIVRLQAGALGLPFMPLRSLMGSSIAEEHHGAGYEEVRNPFDDGEGEPVAVVSALRPDITLLHGVAADDLGNVVLSAPFGESQWGALASRDGVIASVERILPREAIRKHRSDVRIPSTAVLAVCSAELGSHPFGLYNDVVDGVESYLEDADFISEVAEVARDATRFRNWIDDWILGPADHESFLMRLGSDRTEKLRGAANSPQPPVKLTPTARSRTTSAEVSFEADISPTEAMVVTSARVIARLCESRGLTSVLAGVGLSHLASWLGQYISAEQDGWYELLTEIGMYGYLPAPGDPFIFSSSNLATCTSLLDVATVLGAIVGGADNRCLGAIGAAMIDEQGNVGSTFSNEGRFLIGSGGANDIASAASEIVVTVPHSSHRLVPKVNYVTSPGVAVRTVVTDQAVFERKAADERFVLTRLLRGDLRVEAAIEQVRGGCAWTFDVAADVCHEPAPSATELERLRSFDPAGSILEPRRRSGSGA